jgi:uncharacterized membrane protein YcaP (DUF421 family)
MWFDTWYDVWRIAVIGPLAYTTLVVFLRIAGKRTLAKLNAFDFVVTVALGSTLATVILDGAVSVAEGALALGLLVAIQYVVATTTLHLRPLRRLVKSVPTVVVRRGELLDDVIRAERLNDDEIHQALRRSGVAEVADVAAVVLETDGSFSVIEHADEDAPALRGVRGWPDATPATE